MLFWGIALRAGLDTVSLPKTQDIYTLKDKDTLVVRLGLEFGWFGYLSVEFASWMGEGARLGDLHLWTAL